MYFQRRPRCLLAMSPAAGLMGRSCRVFCLCLCSLVDDLLLKTSSRLRLPHSAGRIKIRIISPTFSRYPLHKCISYTLGGRPHNLRYLEMLWRNELHQLQICFCFQDEKKWKIWQYLVLIEHILSFLCLCFCFH